jgi:hypothetical protein
MQKTLFKLSVIACSALILSSCQKNAESLAGGQKLFAFAKNSKPQKSSGKLLTSMQMANGQVLAQFKYDNKKRLIEAKADGTTFRYIYQNNQLTIKRIYEPTQTTLLSLTGKLNTKGYLTEASGSITNGNIVSNVKILYTYDEKGHLVKETYTDANPNGLKLEGVYQWNGDNLIKISYRTNGVESTSVSYEYDLAKINRMGLYTTVNFEWTDGFLGVPSLNLVYKTTYQQGPSVYRSRTDIWTVDAHGYPVSGIVSTGTGEGTIYYHYNR